MDPAIKQQVLSQLTDDEWEAELERRKRELVEKTKPMRLNNPDFSKLSTYCVSVVDHVVSTYNVDDGGYPPKDHKHHIYEMAMLAVYGKDIFKWLNNHSD